MNSYLYIGLFWGSPDLQTYPEDNNYIGCKKLNQILIQNQHSAKVTIAVLRSQHSHLSW